MRTFGAPPLQVYLQVALPAILPYITAGIRQGVGRAVRGMVVADLFLVNTNLGGLLVDAGGLFDMPKLMAATVFVILVGLAAVAGAQAVERRLLRWKGE